MVAWPGTARVRSTLAVHGSSDCGTTPHEEFNLSVTDVDLRLTTVKCLMDAGIGYRESSGGKNSELEKNSELATRDRGEIGRSTFVLKRLLWLGELGLVIEALNRYQIDTNVFCNH